MANETGKKDFLNRWSSRKLAEAEPEKTDAPVALSDTDKEQGEEVDEIVAPPPDLPDVETLNAESDFTAFLGDNVPRDISKLAFKKLWRSDPVLANVDGLNDYDGDFSKVGMVTEVFKSVYQVGKGYHVEEEGIAEDPEQEEGDAAKEAPAEVAIAETPDALPPEEPIGEITPAGPAELSADAAVEAGPLSERLPVKP